MLTAGAVEPAGGAAPLLELLPDPLLVLFELLEPLELELELELLPGARF